MVRFSSENNNLYKKHESAPIFTNCLEFIKNHPTLFCCPGHKGGRTFDPLFAKSMSEIDLSNLKHTDTLHCPTGSILQAEILLADAYGVDRSYILVGGSTTGNVASVMSVAKPNRELLVQRNSHKSIVAGIIHSGAIPVWLNAEWNEENGIFLNLSASTVKNALHNHPDCLALYLLNPTYYGSVPDIRTLVDLCHSQDKLIIADEAHGPHFHFCDQLPLAAEDAGADMIVQSTHKILSALSQGSVLHLNKSRVEEKFVRKVLQLVQTTSPSFIIMASIDLARKQMVLEGSSRFTQIVHLARETREKIREMPGLSLLEKPLNHEMGSGFYDLDETKIVINTKELGISGYDLLKLLNEDYNIQPEIAGPTYVLCIVSVGSIQEDCDRLVEACNNIVRTVKPKSSKYIEKITKIAEQGRALTTSFSIYMTPRDAFYANSINLDVKKCVGRVCAEVVTPYPPGIPVLMPGELITQEIIEFLLEIKALGNPISSTDPLVNTLQVVNM